jgi:hypothetical protein
MNEQRRNRDEIPRLSRRGRLILLSITALASVAFFAADPGQKYWWHLMDVLLPALAFAGAAFCVWLTVRIINRRERWAKWTLAVAVALPLLYVLSIGPAAGALNRVGEPRWAAMIYMRIYGPINWAYRNGPQSARDALEWYLQIWMP